MCVVRRLASGRTLTTRIEVELPRQRSTLPHSMKKLFPLHEAGRDDARVRDRIRQEINRYERRQRRKPLPEGADRWEFECRAGRSADQAEPVAFKSLAAAIDTIASGEANEIYIEIATKPVTRPRL